MLLWANILIPWKKRGQGSPRKEYGTFSYRYNKWSPFEGLSLFLSPRPRIYCYFINILWAIDCWGNLAETRIHWEDCERDGRVHSQLHVPEAAESGISRAKNLGHAQKKNSNNNRPFLPRPLSSGLLANLAADSTGSKETGKSIMCVSFDFFF